jgi:hypothetical protein
MKKWIIKVLKAPVEFFKGLFDNGAEEFMKLIEKVSPLVNKAYPVVKKIAELTPTKADDAVLAAYEHYNMKQLFDADKDKGLALRDLAKAVIKDTSKDPLSDYLLNTAVELAYAKYKEEGK